MFNLLVSYTGWNPPTGKIERSRFLTQTDEAIRNHILKKDGQIDMTTICAIKTVFMPESGSTEAPHEARIGQITTIRDVGSEYVFDFHYDLSLNPIPVEVIEELSQIFGVQGFGLRTTHWSVKNHDIFELLYRYEAGQSESEGVFKIARLPVKQKQIAVMMPFDTSFNPVYESIQKLCTSIGCNCLRADGIWREDSIIQDIVNLIVESKVVVCDLTGRNPNVFYEAGIAHAMRKKIVLITQNDQDVPFDLRHLRYVRYLGNEQGLNDLQNKLHERVWGLIYENANQPCSHAGRAFHARLPFLLLFIHNRVSPRRIGQHCSHR